MGKLFCILGKSGVGKNALFDRIIADRDINIKPVTPYTTRPMRENETNGIQYHFVSESEMREMEVRNEIIEKREYSTVRGVWHYFTVRFTAAFDENHIIITTPHAIPQFIESVGAKNIVIVLLLADDKTRLERSISRESREATPNYAEVCRRYLADEKDFQQMSRYFANDKDSLSEWGSVQKFVIDTVCDLETCVSQFKSILNKIR